MPLWPPNISHRRCGIAPAWKPSRFPVCAGFARSRDGAGSLACIFWIMGICGPMRFLFRTTPWWTAATPYSRIRVERNPIRNSTWSPARWGVPLLPNSLRSIRKQAFVPLINLSLGGLAHSKRLIDCSDDLRHGELVETLAKAVEPALTAFQLA